MIESIKLRNWKSFDKLEFKPENINIIIGANASGKSNFLDALELIQKRINNASEKEIDEIRGGRKYFTQFGEEEYSLEIEDNKKIMKISNGKDKKSFEESLAMKNLLKNLGKEWKKLDISEKFLKEEFLEHVKSEIKKVKMK